MALLKNMNSEIFSSNFSSKLPRSKSASALTRMNGSAIVHYGIRDGFTCLKGLDQRTPLRVMFPKGPKGSPPIAAVTLVSGGLVGGDRLNIKIFADDRTALTAIGQAAEKVYRSNGPDSRVEISLNVGKDAWLEWLPQETILFDGAQLDRCTVANVHSMGRLLAGECLIFGRLASGEIMTNGKVRDSWEVFDATGRLKWADTLLMNNDIIGMLDSPAGFDGARAYATALYVGPDAGEYLPIAKKLTDSTENIRSGVTCRGNVLIARWLSENPLAIRKKFERYWVEMRSLAGGLSSKLSRLWYV